MSVETPLGTQLNQRLLKFFNESYLADCVIKHNDIEINSHKVILAASSSYIHEHFNMNTAKIRKEDKDVVDIPEMIVTDYSKGNLKDCLMIVMKYCYADQNYEAVQGEVTDANMFTVLSFAHCLRITSLVEHLERKIVEGMLKEDNKIKMFYEAQMFELKQLKEVSMQMIKKDFQNIKMGGGDGIEKVIEFNFETFKEMVSSDELRLENEKDVCELILKYIQNRRDIKPVVEDDSKLEEVVQEEKKPEEEPGKEEVPPEGEEKKEEEPPKEEEVPKEEQPPQEETPKEEAIKGPEVNLLQNWKDHLSSIQKTLQRINLTKEQERELIECIRFSFLTHNELIDLSSNEILSDHKDFLLEGLSVRLNTYETTTSKAFKINLTPRQNTIIIPPGTSTEISPQSLQQYKSNQMASSCAYNSQFPQQPNQMYSSVKAQQPNQPNQPNQMYSSVNGQQPNQMYSSAMAQQTASQQGTNNKFFSSTFPNNQPLAISQRMSNTNNDPMNTMYQSIQPNDRYMKSTMSQRFPEEEQQMKIQQDNDRLYQSHTNPRPPQESIVSIDHLKHMSLIDKPSLVFKYEYDFDENGVFYYLGTLGRMAPYHNPHEIAQVKVFASSIGKGALGDFIGRQSVNLRTLNESKSFFGVDLGQERFLIPSSYSIKNRQSSSHVLLCWCLEGSNDKVNWEVLDTRLFSNSNQKYHQSLEKERNMLKKAGSTSTWGISRKIKEKFTKGFRYFILKQIDQNSSGGFNLAISGFELYGEAIGRNWFFH